MEAKRKQVQRRLLISAATDEELKQMAKISAEVFPYTVNQALKDLKQAREEYRKTKEPWRKNLGEPQK